MLATDRSGQLDQLLDTSIADFDIPEEVYRLAVDRYDDIGSWLSDYWATSPSDGIVYPQGSFRLGTVVQPINPSHDYDIDLVCRRDIAMASTTQAALKADAGDGLNSYVSSQPSGTPIRLEGKRCWTLDYQGEPFHIDILPALPDLDTTTNAILITDKSMREWQHSNPIDYASWFHERMRQEFIQLQEAVAKRMQVVDVPEWRVKTTLQRAVQAMKRHRDLFFADEPNDRPASIIITTLAAQAYESGGALYEVLLNVTAKMPDLVEYRNGVRWVANPAQPEENFADRWQKGPGYSQRFFDWIERAHADFAAIGKELGVDRVLEGIAKNFGQRSSQSAGKDLGSSVSRAREAGALGMGAGGILSTAARRSVPPNTFHGDPRPR